MRRSLLVLILGSGILLGGCAGNTLDPDNKYPLTGAAAGAASGALIGAAVGDPFFTAMVGAIAGGIGGLFYREYWKEEVDAYWDQAIDGNF